MMLMMMMMMIFVHDDDDVMMVDINIAVLLVFNLFVINAVCCLMFG